MPSISRRAGCLALLAIAPDAQSRVSGYWRNPLGGLWSNGQNWSGAPSFPNGPTETALIDLPTASAYTVTLTHSVNLAALTINSANATLSNAEGGTLNLNGGTVNIAAGAYRLGGGTLRNATVSGPGQLLTSFGGGGFANVVLDHDLSLGNAFTVNVSDGLTLTAGRTISLVPTDAYTSLSFYGVNPQTLDGEGEIVFNGTSDWRGRIHVGGSLTIGAGMTIRTGTQGGAVGGIFGDHGTITNRGLISASTPGTLLSTGDITNTASGVLEILNGAGMVIAGDWANEGVFLIDSHASNSLFLRGEFSSASIAPERFNRAGGSVILNGVCDNTGRTLTLDVQTKSIALTNGTIIGGVISTPGDRAALVMSNSEGTLRGVTLDTDLRLTNGYALIINDGLTLQAGRTIRLDTTNGFALVRFSGVGAQTIGGSGEVVFDGAEGLQATIDSSLGELAIGAGVTVRTGSRGGRVGRGSAVLNSGTIAARTPGKTIDVQSVTNNPGGVLEASNGATLALSGTWSNAGTFRVLDGTLNLAGAFASSSLAPARFDRAGGTVNILGTVSNTGATLSLDAQSGSFTLKGATIQGGAISGAGAAGLIIAGPGATLAGGVTLDADTLITNGSTLFTNGAFSISPGKTITLASTGLPTFLDVANISGGGHVVFNGTDSSNNFIRASGTLLTVGPGSSIRSGTAGGLIGFEGTITNRGVVSAETPGATVAILTPDSLRNEGVMTASNGGTLWIGRAGGLSSNTGADLIARTGGTLRFNSGMNVATNGGFDLEVASASQTLGYGRIAITGNAAISGTDIDLIFTGGFTPDWGDTFNILSFTTLTGDMSSLALPTLADPTLRWWREQTASAYRVGVRHIADNNRDGVVDFLDLNRVLGTFGQAGMSLQGDGNEDGVVDFFDLNDVLSLFGQSAPPNPIPAPGALALFAGAAALGGSRRRR